MNVYQMRPALPLPAAWIRNTLRSYVKACRFKNDPLSIELRPMVGAIGYVAAIVPHDRICLSNRAVFWSAESLISTTIHEYCHRLVMEFDTKSKVAIRNHGPVFFLVLMTLFKRIDLSNGTKYVSTLSLYDFQDEPDDAADINSVWSVAWRPAVLDWALSKCDGLARSNVCAEDLPEAVYRRWLEFLEDCSQKDKSAVSAAVEAQDLKQHAENLKAEISNLQMQRSLFISFLLITIFFSFCLAFLII